MNSIYKELARGRGSLIASRSDEVEMVLNRATGVHELFVKDKLLFGFLVDYSVQYIYEGLSLFYGICLRSDVICRIISA
jgi:hypothetical protein